MKEILLLFVDYFYYSLQSEKGLTLCLPVTTKCWWSPFENSLDSDQARQSGLIWTQTVWHEYDYDGIFKRNVFNLQTTKKYAELLSRLKS